MKVKACKFAAAIRLGISGEVIDFAHSGLHEIILDEKTKTFTITSKKNGVPVKVFPTNVAWYEEDVEN